MPETPPDRIRPRSLADYLEVMTKAVFQSGMSWQVVESKWDGFRKAFRGFEPERVAKLKPREIEAICADPSIIRNANKVLATVDNADTMVSLDSEHGGFRKYLRSHEDFWETAADLKRQFRFVGDFGAYYFLYVVGEKVPPHDEWRAAQVKKGGGRPRTGAGAKASAGARKKSAAR